MQVKCPECGTPFKVKDELLEPKGKKLKCTKCAHRWHQDPPSALAAAAPEPAPAPKPEPKPEPEPAPAPPPEPAPAPAPADVPLSADPGDAPAPAEDDTPAAPDDVPMSADPNDDQTLADIIGMDDAGDDGVAMSADPEGYEPPSKDDLGGDDLGLDIDDSDLDGLFGDSGGKEDHKDVDDLLNEDDPEPIPEMFSASPFKNKAAKKKSKLPLVLFLLVVLLGGAFGGVWYFRAMIEDMVPAAKPYLAYLDMMPFGQPEPGEGLEFGGGDKIKSEFTEDALIIRGSVVNANSGERPLPNIKLVIYDAAEQPIQETIAQPPQPTISGGGTVRFIVRLENPSENAKSFKLYFTDEPVGGAMDGAQ